MTHSLNLIRAVREFGVRGTFYKFWQMRHIKFGRLVGVDSLGEPRGGRWPRFGAFL
jgi:hypothetical protein